MFFAGAGLGAGMPILNLAVQNEFTQKDLGAATASVQLFRGLGSTIGTAILGTILVSGVTTQLGDLTTDPYIQTLRQQPAASQMLERINTDTALNLNTHDVKDKVAAGIEAGTAALPAPLRESVRQQFTSKQDAYNDKIVSAFSDSLRTVFYISSGLMLLATLVATGMIERPLRGGHDDTPGVA